MIVVVPATDALAPLIIHSVTRSLRRSTYVGDADPAIIATKVTHLLRAPSWSTVIAIDDEEPDEALGFLVYKDATTVGWLQVKAYAQARGVGKQLLDHAGIRVGDVDCAFLTPGAIRKAATKGYALRFRPYLVDSAAAEIAALLDDDV